MISNEQVKEVVNVVTVITITIISTYPVFYILRSMIDFVTKAFRYVNVDKVFKSVYPLKKLKGR